MKETVPSMTAYAVAQGILEMQNEPKFAPLIPKEAVFLLKAFVEEWRTQFRPWKSVYSTELKAITTPTSLGIEPHYVMRKYAIEQEVREAIKQGANTILNISAGLDTLTLRLSKEFPQVSFIEVDHPATQGVKTRALERIKFPSLTNLVLQPCDFEKTTLKEAIQSSGFKAQGKTLFIIEGLTMYLTLAQMEGLLRSLREMSSPGSGLMVGILGDATIATGNKSEETALAEGLENAGEKLQFARPFSAVPAFLREHGFEVVKQARMADLQQDVSPPALLHKMRQREYGEHFFVAQKREASQSAVPPKIMPLRLSLPTHLTR